ncbi:MAG: amino acid racemase [Ruminococcaceae bacterium]|jgi:aspartate racemase|nr:amino acid racemase [Oscillospiraceae bacterium]
MKKTIGILGGMGPLATADLFRKIVTLTRADRDNDHIRVYIDSNAAIPDRTAAILSGGPDPVPEMLSALRHLEACGADCIVMPCNTAHYFLSRLQAATDTPVLSMLEATARCCARRYPGERPAVLATRGTLTTGLYDRALAAAGVDFLLPDEEERDTLMYLIYDVVKASRPLTPESDVWRDLLAGLRARGADYFILGCTELPILADTLAVPGPFVDPTAELARAAIRFCGYEAAEK